MRPLHVTDCARRCAARGLVALVLEACSGAGSETAGQLNDGTAPDSLVDMLDGKDSEWRATRTADDGDRTTQPDQPAGAGQGPHANGDGDVADSLSQGQPAAGTPSTACRGPQARGDRGE